MTMTDGGCAALKTWEILGQSKMIFQLVIYKLMVSVDKFCVDKIIFNPTCTQYNVLVGLDATLYTLEPKLSSFALMKTAAVNAAAWSS